MRKAEKRRLGRIKFEKDMADSKAHGLRMQELDKKRRAQQLKDTLVQRDVKNLQHVQGKVAKAKQKRELYAGEEEILKDLEFTPDCESGW